MRDRRTSLDRRTFVALLAAGAGAPPDACARGRSRSWRCTPTLARTSSALRRRPGGRHTDQAGLRHASRRACNTPGRIRVDRYLYVASEPAAPPANEAGRQDQHHVTAFQYRTRRTVELRQVGEAMRPCRFSGSQSTCPLYSRVTAHCWWLSTVRVRCGCIASKPRFHPGRRRCRSSAWTKPALRAPGARDTGRSPRHC